MFLTHRSPRHAINIKVVSFSIKLVTLQQLFVNVAEISARRSRGKTWGGEGKRGGGEGEEITSCCEFSSRFDIVFTRVTNAIDLHFHPQNDVTFSVANLPRYYDGSLEHSRFLSRGNAKRPSADARPGVLFSVCREYVPCICIY